MGIQERHASVQNTTMPAKLSSEKAQAKGAKKRLLEHPPFAEMVSTAILGGDARRGTSRQAIKTSILAEHGLPATPYYNMQINKAIRRGLAKGKLRTDRFRAGHYKIAKTAPAVTAATAVTEKKVTAKTEEKKKATAKKAAKKPVKMAKKETTEKVTAKKVTTKKVTAKKVTVKKVTAKKVTA